LKILLEMRPALDGHAGIPQEARLLFRGLSTLEGLQVEGLLQSSNRVIAQGLPTEPAALAALKADQRIHRLSRVVITLRPQEHKRRLERWAEQWRHVTAPTATLLRALLGRLEPLGRFEAEPFKDFVWRDLFARTLPVADLPVVSHGDFRVARTPWNAMHAGGLLTRRLGGAHYPRLDTRGFDVMIAETPYPGRVAPGTQMVVRYHDAIPLLMPHTITDKAFHQAAHYHALQRNVADGAWFACVSEATRRDLLGIFPQVEPRCVTIHNMVSHHYHPGAPVSPERLYEIVRTRRNASVVAAEPDAAAWCAQAPRYLLMVSTIEPRKNHATLLAAWEQLRVERFPDLKLVIVGSLGWDHTPIVKRFKPWLARGEVQMLEEVPPGELRLLYQHAAATVCPSFGEGFDFSGVEAMRCGGAVVASDIQVHRDIYADAAEFFNPYSAPDLAQALAVVVDPLAVERRVDLVARGAAVAARYLPEVILPRWREFLLGLKATGRPGEAGATAVRAAA
jgi:glycosyltransferase involved in cell wall biosynthesis